jgi:hypothetical protein
MVPPATVGSDQFAGKPEMRAAPWRPLDIDFPLLRCEHRRWRSEADMDLRQTFHAAPEVVPEVERLKA